MYTIEQYNSLCAAISLGATKVNYGDKSVEYRSLEEMIRLKQIMESQLFPAQSVKAQTNRRKYAEYGRGYEQGTIEGESFR